MSEQDDLRDRIAAAIERGFNESANLNDYEAETLAMAQAVIDEFELTTETHAATHAKRTMTRIISAWEWDNQ